MCFTNQSVLNQNMKLKKIYLSIFFMSNSTNANWLFNISIIVYSAYFYVLQSWQSKSLSHSTDLYSDFIKASKLCDFLLHFGLFTKTKQR